LPFFSSPSANRCPVHFATYFDRYFSGITNPCTAQTYQPSISVNKMTLFQQTPLFSATALW